MHSRRSLLLRVAAAAPALLLAAVVQAQTDVKIMVPGTPGGGFDQAARALGKALQEAQAAKAVAFEYKPGAGGSIGLAQFVNASKGDPNALIVVSANTVTGILQNKAPITLANATPVARVFTEFNVIAVAKASPHKSIKDLMDTLKKDPTSVRWGGGSKGSVDHIGLIELAATVGVPNGRVNYSPFGGGGETAAALLGGHITAITGGYPEIAKYVEAGQMRLLAVAAPQRVPGIDVPTLKEQGYEVSTGNWRIFYGAPAISATQQKALVEAVSKAAATPGWQNALKTNLWTPTLLTGAELDAFVQAETQRLESALKSTGLL